MTLTRVRHTLLALGAAALAACSGGAGTTRSTTPSALRMTRGTIAATGVGTILVNGVEIATAGAAIRVDDAPGGLDDLLPGSVVVVRGEIGPRHGEAAEIEIEHGVRGRVRSVSGGVADVGGVEVHLDPSTIGSAHAGGRVRVSGVPDDKGGLRASRVDDDPANGEDVEVKGVVSALGATTFELRLSRDATTSIVVDFSGTTLPAGVENGSFVEVRAAAPASGVPATLVATSITLEDRFELRRELEAELEGILTSDPLSIAGGFELVLDGVTVRTDAATRFENGQPADLVRGVRLEAEGMLDAGGVLHAEKISFRDVVRITAPVDAVGADRLTVLGVDVLLSDFVDLDPSLGTSILPGAVVQVRGYPTAAGAVVALRVDDRSGESRVTLQGVVASVDGTDPSQPSFVILGVRVTTTSSSELRARDGTLLDGPGLLAAVEPGRTVLEARTRSNPGADVVVSPPASTLVAKQIEIEGNDG